MESIPVLALSKTFVTTETVLTYVRKHLCGSPFNLRNSRRCCHYKLRYYQEDPCNRTLRWGVILVCQNRQRFVDQVCLWQHQRPVNKPLEFYHLALGINAAWYANSHPTPAPAPAFFGQKAEQKENLKFTSPQESKLLRFIWIRWLRQVTKKFVTTISTGDKSSTTVTAIYNTEAVLSLVREGVLPTLWSENVQPKLTRTKSAGNTSFLVRGGICFTIWIVRQKRKHFFWHEIKKLLVWWPLKRRKSTRKLWRLRLTDNK